MVTEERAMMLRRYWSSACPKCPLKAQCTPSSNRRITRREHEEMLEAVQRRLEQSPESMMIRRRTVEHVFGTLKSWMGYTHFLTRRLPNVGAEMSLNMLAYNFKRVLSILGFQAMMKAMRLAGACEPFAVICGHSQGQYSAIEPLERRLSTCSPKIDC